MPFNYSSISRLRLPNRQRYHALSSPFFSLATDAAVVPRVAAGRLTDAHAYGSLGMAATTPGKERKEWANRDATLAGKGVVFTPEDDARLITAFDAHLRELGPDAEPAGVKPSQLRDDLRLYGMAGSKITEQLCRLGKLKRGDRSEAGKARRVVQRKASHAEVHA